MGSRIAVTLTVASAVLLAVIVFSCHCALRSAGIGRSSSNQMATAVVPQTGQNVIRVDENGRFRLNGVCVDLQGMRSVLIDASSKLAAAQERPVVVIRAPAKVPLFRIRKAIDTLHATGFSRIVLDDDSGVTADISEVWVGKPSPAKYAGALIMTSSTEGHNPDPAVIGRGEKVIIVCTQDSRHGELVHLLAGLHSRGITDVCVNAVSRDELAEWTVGRYGE